VGRLVLATRPERHAELTLDGPPLSCTVDGATASFPAALDRDVSHLVACAPAGSLPSGRVEIPMAPIGRPRIAVEMASAKGPSGQLRVTITDEQGMRVGRLHPVVEEERDLYVGVLSESETKGVYFAPYGFRGPSHPKALRVRVIGDTVVPTATVPFPGEAAPPKHEPSTVLEFGVAGLASYGGNPIGVGGEAEARLAIKRPNGAILAGVSGGWSKMFDGTIGADDADATAVSMRALVGYRFGSKTWQPYVTLGPEVLRQHVDVKDRDAREWIVGGSGGGGIDLILGPGAFFAEGRARIVFPPTKEDPSLPASAGVVLLGYRLRLTE
jgi:hypothetical protein